MHNTQNYIITTFNVRKTLKYPRILHSSDLHSNRLNFKMIDLDNNYNKDIVKLFFTSLIKFVIWNSCLHANKVNYMPMNELRILYWLNILLALFTSFVSRLLKIDLILPFMHACINSFVWISLI